MQVRARLAHRPVDERRRVGVVQWVDDHGHKALVVARLQKGLEGGPVARVGAVGELHALGVAGSARGKDDDARGVRRECEIAAELGGRQRRVLGKRRDVEEQHVRRLLCDELQHVLRRVLVHEHELGGGDRHLVQHALGRVGLPVDGDGDGARHHGGQAEDHVAQRVVREVVRLAIAETQARVPEYTRRTLCERPKLAAAEGRRGERLVGVDRVEGDEGLVVARRVKRLHVRLECLRRFLHKLW
mmetsp:Transcript_51315/g.111602  ORF Transcript_51315/g.111602 Transcript_51315/m.111602 type:complete len:244 (-) Transcript_51315:171-902(-)